jgi:hypothetical protein
MHFGGFSEMGLAVNHKGNTGVESWHRTRGIAHDERACNHKQLEAATAQPRAHNIDARKPPGRKLTYGRENRRDEEEAQYPRDMGR